MYITDARGASNDSKQRICESENHYIKNHSLHQKVWPSEIMAPD